MNEVNKLLEEFPQGAQPLLRAGWQSLSPERQRELLSLIPALPTTPGKIQKLFELSHQQAQMSFGQKHDVAIIGPANAGKSTLYNRLIANPKDEAAVSPVPGTTRETQAGSAGPFTVVDTPGADAVGDLGARERQLALEAARQADFLLVVFDALQGIRRSEQEFFATVRELFRPYIVVLNKIDLVRGSEQAVIAQAAANLGLERRQVIPISAKSGKNIKRVVEAIVMAEPALLAALGQGLPAYRGTLAWRVITGAATTASLIALTPLPLLDFLPLVAIQSSMILGIARIYDYRLSLGRVREIIGVFGIGFLGRTLFYELIKIGGPPAWIISAAVAAGTTVAIGLAARQWFETGERVSREQTQAISRSISRNLIDKVKRPWRFRFSRAGLEQHIDEAASETLDEPLQDNASPASHSRMEAQRSD